MLARRKEALRGHFRSMGAAYWVLLIALLSTAIVYLQLQRQLKLRERLYSEEAFQAANVLSDLSVRSHLGLLQAVRGLFLANTNLTQEQWQSFFQTFHLATDFPGLLDVGLVVRVPSGERRKHEAALRQTGLPTYHLSANSGRRENYYPFVYFRNVRADSGPSQIGHDAAADPAQRFAMEKARDGGRPVSTRRTDASAGKPADAYMVYLPIYSGGSIPPNLPERRAALRGFAVGSYLPERLWTGMLATQSPPVRKTLAQLAIVSALILSALLFGIAWTLARSRAASERLTTKLRRSEQDLRQANEQLQLGILEARHAQEALTATHYSAQSERERLSVTLRSIGEAVVASDDRGRVRFLNHVAEALTGWSASEAIGRPLGDLLQLQDRETKEPRQDELRQVLETGQILSLSKDTVLVSRNGESKSISGTAAPIRAADGTIAGAVLVARDTTEQERLETQLLTAHKLESLGVLASGLAHDFNTLLTGVLANVGVAQMLAGADTSLAERLSHAEKACLRAQELTERLLLFARSGPPVSRAVAITELLEDTARLALANSSCRCEIVHPPDLWPVHVDEAQICQVIYDLVSNAAQVMPGGGTIHLVTKNLTLPSGRVLPLVPGSYVQIAVQDHGPGIPPDRLSRIFDPYFTTKERGSGLGLATAYFVLQRHRGLILAESEPGQGTTFRLYLPATPGLVPSASPPLPTLPGVQGQVLLMDDEPLILSLGTMTLKRLGYDVEVARDGEEALQRFQKAHALGHPYKAVILDLTVQGGLNGPETLKRMQSLDPKVKAIIASRYLDDPVMLNFRQHGFVAAIAKPFHASELAKILDRAG